MPASKTLKVYSYHSHRSDSPRAANGSSQCIEVIAATSVAEVLRLRGISRTDYAWRGRVLGTGRGDAVPIALALAEPGVVFWMPEHLSWRFDTAIWTKEGLSYGNVV